MERALQKLAKQLVAFDEASLMALWDKYARQVADFEPGKQWQEAVLILGFIQSVRFKNQLLNHHWAEVAAPGDRPAPQLAPKEAPGTREAEVEVLAVAPAKPKRPSKPGKVLAFIPRPEKEQGR